MPAQWASAHRLVSQTLQLEIRKHAFAAIGRGWTSGIAKSRGAGGAALRLFEIGLKIECYFIATAFGGDAIPPSTLSGHETSINSYWRS